MEMFISSTFFITSTGRRPKILPAGSYDLQVAPNHGSEQLRKQPIPSEGMPHCMIGWHDFGHWVEDGDTPIFEHCSHALITPSVAIGQASCFFFAYVTTLTFFYWW